ncbi:MAG: tetratricopeptide repeat protein [Bacteroidetes bacterium]|nr:tetratricopeptide repeat protein [Bacteroidota bacterium]
MRFSRVIILLILTTFLNFGANAQIRSNFLQYGNIELRNGNYLQAIVYLNQAIQLESNSYFAYYLRGISKFNLDDISGAEMDYTTAINLLPYYAEFFHNRAIARSVLLRYDEAFQDYTKALKIDSTDASIYFSRAKTYMNIDKYDEAIKDCDRAISLKYNHESIYILRGSAKAGGKYYEEAIKDLNLVLEYNPEYIMGYIQRGKVWIELEKPDSAIADFNFVLARDTNNSYAYFSRSLANIKKKDDKAALADLDHVLRISPRNSYALFNKAIIKINNQDLRGAIEELDKVIKINPKNITSYFYRGKLKSDLKDYAGALEDFNKTVEIHPEFSNGYMERSMIKNRMGLFDEAKKDNDKAIKLGNLTDLETNNLTPEKIAYLNSLVHLRADFTEIKDSKNMPQYQYFDIDMLPLFQKSIDDTPALKEKIYDAYQKPVYDESLISLTNSPVQPNVSEISVKIEELTNLINTSPGQSSNYLNRANLYAAIQNFNDAFRDYDAAIEKNPSNLLAYFSRANSNYLLTELIKSIGYKQQAITISQEQKEPEKKEDNSNNEYLVKALNDYKKVLRLDPNFAYAYYNSGYVNCIMGDYKNAVDDFTYAIQRNNTFAEAYYNRGLILIFQNENKIGCLDLSKAGELGIPNAYSVMKRYCHQ